MFININVKEDEVMNRKVMKVVSILLVILMAFAMLSTGVFAAVTADQALKTDQFTGGDNTGASEAAQSIIGSIITFVQVIGVGVAIIMLIVLAIKYISAAPNEKAEIKKSITIYVVGVIVLFAATGILQIVKSFAGNINTSAKNKAADSATGVVEVIDTDNTYLA